MVNLINNKTLYPDLLPNTTIIIDYSNFDSKSDTGLGGINAYRQITGDGIVGFLSEWISDIAIAQAQVARFYQIPQIGYWATSTQLSDKGQYPYFLRVCPH